MSSTPALNAQGQPIRSALKSEDDVTRTPPSLPTKVVQIAEPEPLPEEEPLPKRQFAASMIGKRLSGRPPMVPGNSSHSSFTLDSLQLTGDQSNGSGTAQSPEAGTAQAGQQQQGHHHHISQRVDRVSEKLIAQVADWLQREKVKRESKKPRKRHHHIRRRHHKAQPQEETVSEEPEHEFEVSLERTASIDSASSDVSLDRLQRIIDDSMAALGLNNISQLGPKPGRRSSYRSKKYASRSTLHLTRTASSDTDYVDGDVLVPCCDAILDNTKTLKYSQGGADDSMSICSQREEKERLVWLAFKNEIIRLAHTLRLKGWRRVALDSGDDITVERLSGALTNAVYVVTPPEVLPSVTEHVTKKKPQKLLLRIYGPNAENLIDRDIELGVLKRLARKKIGPRLLGTFTNGRFEQYFNAEALTPGALRDPDTSKQIAKRMRELHEGIDLLEEEKNAGPAVFNNWDCWLANVERRAQFLDQQILAHNPSVPLQSGDAWKKRGFVCGVEWPKFKVMVDRYRQFLIESYGGSAAIREKLVFAHNDTQYGNILRIRPDDEKSPLLQPENEHKQLIVIDFEYAAANLPGFEFANHFTEWAYNYHDATASHACNTHLYPTPEEQQRFLKAYVEHRTKFQSSSSTTAASDQEDVTPSATPLATPNGGPTPSSSIVEFMLDARVPPGGWKEEERRATELNEQKLRDLAREARLWRAMNSAQWVAWGIAQAKIAGFSENEAPLPSATAGGAVSSSTGADIAGITGVASATATATAEDAQGPASPVDSEGTVTADEDGSAAVDAQTGSNEEEEGFDYLSYAHDRALFFWGDVVQMGLVKLEELPEGLRERVKMVEH